MNKTQRKYYGQIKKELELIGTYSPADEMLIEDAAYCRQLVEEARQIVESKDIEDRHLQHFPKTGSVQINPAMNNLRGLQQDWIKYCDVLGLSPKARKALAIDSAKPKAVSKLMQIKSKKAAG